MRITRNLLSRIKLRYFNEYFPKNSLKSKDLKGEVTLDRIVNEYSNQCLSINANSFVESEKQMNRWGNQNKVKTSYYGLGYYPSFTPAVLKNSFISNPNFYSAYIPYQSEISQGRLELQFNYQKLITNLFQTDVSNCSLLDESSSITEALISIISSDKKYRSPDLKVYVDKHAFPQNKAVIETRCNLLNIQVEYLDINNKLLNSENSNNLFGNRPSILILQTPNSYGGVYDNSKYILDLKNRYPDLSVIVSTDPLLCSITEPPGTFNADIITGSMGRFGLPMWNGGPHAGIFACKEKYIRHMPGRIVGKSRDTFGDECYRLALQAREQHIKKDRALSNICTSQALLANYSTLWAMYMGPKGISEIGRGIREKVLYLRDFINCAENFNIIPDHFEHDIFDTITFSVSNETKYNELKYICDKNKLFLRFNDDNLNVTISFDETKTLDDLDFLKYECLNFVNKSEINIRELPSRHTRQEPNTPRKSELLTDSAFNIYNDEHSITRYITKLANRDISLTHSMIPLGSCTMKLNSAYLFNSLFHEKWANIHPFQEKTDLQGYISMINKLEKWLGDITGLPNLSFQSNSGATGEYSAMNCFKKYFMDKDESNRNILLIPDSAHGTNFATGNICGFKVVKLKSTEMGELDMEYFDKVISNYAGNIAGLMITYPSTFGFFEKNFKSVVNKVKEDGGLVYCDGANMNALMGNVNLSELGIDACHMNLHKTFGIPHGGGGPGMGPIAVTDSLAPYLPDHPIYNLGHKKSYGTCAGAPNSSAILLTIVYYYISLLGELGIKHASEMALINANYIAQQLEPHYSIPYKNRYGLVSHELILKTDNLENGITEKDIAKRLMDYGFHAPTMSWPVPKSLMIEPTETESREELDRFILAMKQIRNEIREKPELLKNAPHSIKLLYKDSWRYPYTKDEAFFPVEYLRENKFNIPVSRVDDVYGDRNLVLK